MRRGVRASWATALTAVNLFLGLTGMAQPNTPPTQTNTPATSVPEPSFEVRNYHVRGNTVLKRETIDAILAEAKGKQVTLSQIRKALANLQSAYRERGWSTVGVSLPQQQLTNATVLVQVTEAPLANVNVIGERFFSSNNVMRALPSLMTIYHWTNVMLNSFVLQQELDLANANPDRQIYPILGPGPEPGTSELTLKVKDRLPLHSRLDLNNAYTPGTPQLRVNFNAQYNNLWDYDHQVGIQYTFSPQALKTSSTLDSWPFDAPLIANYSAFYRMPFGDAAPAEDQIEADPLNFGYNEATHRFSLPPPIGRPDLTVYASRSTTDTGVKFGPRKTVAQTSFITIVSQDSGEDSTLNEGFGARLAAPLPRLAGIRSTLSFGFDFKRYILESHNTNNFYITTVITNSSGAQTLENTVSSPQPVVNNEVNYLPFNFGWDASLADRLGTTVFNTAVNFNFLYPPAGAGPGEPLSGNAAFAAAGYSTNATAHYVTVNLGMSREQKLYRDWTVLVRANGQWASGPLIGNEQWAMGGLAGVRGYLDGQAYGDEGWRVQLEPRTPSYNLGLVDNRAPLLVRGSVFMDYGRTYLLDTTTGAGPGSSFWGCGFGGTASIGNHFDARLSFAWPLLSAAGVKAGDTHVYFSLGIQF